MIRNNFQDDTTLFPKVESFVTTSAETPKLRKWGEGEGCRDGLDIIVIDKDVGIY